jgi:hypothetical protein
MKPKKKRHVPPPPASKLPKRYWLAALALFLLTLAAFYNSFANGFALDSQMLLLHDPRIQQLTADNLGLILRHTYWWPNGEAGLYRPLATLSYLFNYAILGDADHATGYHAINLLLHTSNVLLAFALALRLFAQRANAFLLAFFTAALWAVHPVLTESVTNLAGRPDLLAAAAVLSGFLLYLKSTESTGRRRIFFLAALALAAAAGTFSKESAVVLPGIFVLYELICWKREEAFPWHRVIYGCLAALLPIAILLGQRAVVLAASPPAEWPFVDNPIANASFWIGRLTAINVLARYLWLAVWPAKLSADYSYSEIPLANGSVNDWIAWLAIALALAVTISLYRRDRLAFFFAGFAFLNLLPASNLLFPIGTIMAERLLYLPLFSLAALAVIAIYAAAERFHLPSRAPVILLCLIAAVFTVRTWLRNSDWKDDLAMAEASVPSSPNSFKVHRLLAAELLRSNPESNNPDRNIDRAIAEADRSVAILGNLPDHLNVADPWTVAATAHLAKKTAAQYQQAISLARRSIAIESAAHADYDRRHRIKSPLPASASDAYRILASAYLRRGQADLALPAALQARTLDPRNAEVYSIAADAYLVQRRSEDAAITLAEGMFATSSFELREDLLKLYQKSDLDTSGCAVVPGPRGPALNPACDLVRRDLCAGTERAHRPDLRQQLNCSN